MQQVLYFFEKLMSILISFPHVQISLVKSFKDGLFPYLSGLPGSGGVDKMNK